MATNSHIEWTDSTWNPVTGCTKISPGCKHCYAERMAQPTAGYGPGELPQRLRSDAATANARATAEMEVAKAIFVNSMSDLFHEEVPSDVSSSDVFDIMRRAALAPIPGADKTLRAPAGTEHQADHGSRQIWMGVSVENEDYTVRIDDLRQTGAHVKFLSLEPLLGPLRKLNLRGIDWVIVGGESGPGARPMDSEWVRNIRDQCLDADVQFFFKQWGGVNKKKAGRALDGRIWEQMPEPLVVL